MIRQGTAWIVTAAFVAGLTGSVFAQATGAPSSTAPAPATSGTSSTPAAPAPKPAAKPEAMKKKSVTGAVKGASGDSLMLVTKGKDGKAKDWTFVLDKDTKLMKAGKAIEAKDITDKDSATVAYTEAEGKMMAKTVTVTVPKAAKKPQPQG